MANFPTHDELVDRVADADFEKRDDLTAGVYRPSDPGPIFQVLRNEFGAREYYCSC